MAGADVGVGHHQRRQAAAARPGVDLRGVPRRRRGVPARPARPRAASAAVDHHRWCPRADRRGRAGPARQPAAALCDPPGPHVVAKVSAGDQDEVKADYWHIFDDITVDAGAAAVAQARQRAAAFDDKWRSRYPSAVACITDDLEVLTVHLRFPRDHWRRIRHTNLIERTFGETRRRVKVIGRLPGERSCLSLVWAVLDGAGRGWRGVVQTPANVRLLQQLRRELHHPPAATDPASPDIPEAVTPAA